NPLEEMSSVEGDTKELRKQATGISVKAKVVRRRSYVSIMLTTVPAPPLVCSGSGICAILVIGSYLYGSGNASFDAM
ncbi:hypothetical protein STEG23_034220, partial [Scotinomys teguina]